MPLTSNWNIWTPDDADNYDFIVDAAATAQTVDDALSDAANAFKGTVAERTAFTSTAVDGMLWQDTDDIKMIWRKDGASWVPAVWRWGGTTAQMNAFTQAPGGFEWHNSTTGVNYVRVGGAWGLYSASGSTTFTGLVANTNASVTINYAAANFQQTPSIFLQGMTGAAASTGVNFWVASATNTSAVLTINKAASSNHTVRWLATSALGV